jgi:hypothetical protein
VGCLKISPEAKLNFEQAAKLWLETNKHALSSNTAKRRKMYIKGLAPNFRNLPIRNIAERTLHSPVTSARHGRIGEHIRVNTSIRHW